MNPSEIKAGQKLTMQFELKKRTAYFISRQPAKDDRAAVNFLRVPDFAGLNGSDDKGTCRMSDYQLSRIGQYA